MRIEDTIGVVISFLVFLSGIYWLSRKEKKMVRFSLESGATISGIQKISGSYTHGELAAGTVTDFVTEGALIQGIESGLVCVVLDRKKHIVAKFPVLITGEYNVPDKGMGKMVMTSFDSTIDTATIPKGPGYIRLGSGNQRGLWLMLGSPLSIIIG